MFLPYSYSVSSADTKKLLWKMHDYVFYEFNLFLTGKFAWNKKIEDDLVQEDQNRGARNAASYTPTFFTAPQNHAALQAARPQVKNIRFSELYSEATNWFV